MAMKMIICLRNIIKMFVKTGVGMPLNANFGSPHAIERILSNLYPSVFFMNGYCFRTTEGFIQGIKFPENDSRRLRCFSLIGVKAKVLGMEAEGICVWLLNGSIAAYGSPEHHAAIEDAIRMKFVQNTDLMEALLSTDEEIAHEVGHESPNTSLPKTLFCRILTSLREQYKSQRDS